MIIVYKQDYTDGKRVVDCYTCYVTTSIDKNNKSCAVCGTVLWADDCDGVNYEIT